MSISACGGDSSPAPAGQRLPVVFYNLAGGNKLANAGIWRSNPMKTLFLLAVALVLAASGSFGQNGNITVSGTAYVNELNVSGVLDVLGNTQYLGTTSGSSQGVTFTYSDSAPATYSTILTQPDSAWSWPSKLLRITS